MYFTKTEIETLVVSAGESGTAFIAVRKVVQE